MAAGELILFLTVKLKSQTICAF